MVTEDLKKEVKEKTWMEGIYCSCGSSIIGGDSMELNDNSYAPFMINRQIILPAYQKERISYSPKNVANQHYFVLES